jgi:glycosyltransferase involved in cell wall biosynthesis
VRQTATADLIDVVLVWRQHEFVRSGRRAESVAAWLNRRPEIGRVFYVEPPVSRKEFDGARWRKLLPLQTEQGGDGVVRVTLLKPNTIVGLDGSGVEERTSWISVRLLQRFLDRESRGPRWLWIYPPHPFAAALVDAVRHQRLICDVVDDVLSRTAEEERYCEALIARSDMAFATAEDLAARLRRWQPLAAYVPNGLDPSFLADRNAPPSNRARRGPKVIGYVGVISERTDPALLTAVVDRFPDCVLELVGWVNGWTDEVHALMRRPNVRFRGRVPFEEIARAIDGFDVCLLPHRDNALSRSMSPLKLFQYVARGKPVVATPVAGLEPLADVIQIAEPTGPFLDALARALDADASDQVSRMRRIDAAARHTWPERVAAMMDMIAVGEPMGTTSRA